MFDKYTVIRTLDMLEAVDGYMMTDDKPNFQIVAFDTETNGLDFWRNVMIGFSFSIDTKSGFYLPILEWHPDPDSLVSKGDEQVFENGHFVDVWTGQTYPESVTQATFKTHDFISFFLKRWFCHDDVSLIMHNAPFDVSVVWSNTNQEVNLAPFLSCDTLLLKHVIESTTPMGLKEVAKQWQRELGISAEEEANKEQQELGKSILRNGGKYNMRNKHVWRGSPDIVAKYAIADTFLTLGIFFVGLDKLEKEFTPEHAVWFFDDEVMPLCREVVIPMLIEGVRIDVEHFKQLEKDTAKFLTELEDEFIKYAPTEGFSVGKGLDDISTKQVLLQIMEREGLTQPLLKDKPSLSKPAIKKAYEEDPHWFWGHLLGLEPMRYTDEQIRQIRQELFAKSTGRRHRFNVNSTQHLRWLFCEKLGYSREELPQTKSATKKNPIPSMKAEVLRDFFMKDHPSFVGPLVLWKRLDKLYKSYVMPALTLNNNGWLHMNMNQAGTKSGRFSCSGGFNLQTLPRVEALGKCSKCGSKKVTHSHPHGLLVTDVECQDCGHIKKDVVSPSAIKMGFVAPEGTKIVNTDYASLEPRVFSWVSGDPKLKAVYKEDLDLYSKIYCDMEDKEGKYSPNPKDPNFLKKLAPELRDMVKPVVLGVPYGARGPQTAKLMKFKKTIVRDGVPMEVIDVERGDAFRNKYLDTYPELKAYMLIQDTKCVTYGFVETHIGRRIRMKYTVPVYALINQMGMTIDEFLDMKRNVLTKQDVNKVLTKSALFELGKLCGFEVYPARKPPRDWAWVRAMFKNELNLSKNFPIQGMAAHITNRGMLEMTREFKRQGLGTRICLQVHDEITTYALLAEVETSKVVIEDCMVHNKYAQCLDVPMGAEPTVCDNLKESK